MFSLPFPAISYYRYTGYTVIVRKTNRLRFKHVINRAYIIAHARARSSKRSQVAVAFKVLQLAKNMRMTVTDAVDTLIADRKAMPRGLSIL